MIRERPRRTRRVAGVYAGKVRSHLSASVPSTQYPVPSTQYPVPSSLGAVGLLLTLTGLRIFGVGIDECSAR
ncbi:hypothetical protein D2E45_18730 [Mycobacteroides abscessus]|nr:hypothetical protein D2E45_18730 [Mycobacteroides abscessus]